MRKNLTRDELAEIRGVLEANGLMPCNHPDCDPKQPSCATNYVYLRSLEAAKTVYRLAAARHGRTLQPASVLEPQG